MQKLRLPTPSPRFSIALIDVTVGRPCLSLYGEVLSCNEMSLVGASLDSPLNLSPVLEQLHGPYRLSVYEVLQCARPYIYPALAIVRYLVEPRVMRSTLPSLYLYRPNLGYSYTAFYCLSPLAGILLPPPDIATTNPPCTPLLPTATLFTNKCLVHGRNRMPVQDVHKGQDEPARLALTRTREHAGHASHEVRP